MARIYEDKCCIVWVIDERGAGNANHCYEIAIKEDGLGAIPLEKSALRPRLEVKFQQGPLQVVAVNGISNEALLAIVIDRLRGFQSGDFKCRENALALTKLQEALHWLDHRTRDREARGVEGRHEV